MNLEEVKAILAKVPYDIKREERMSDDRGTRLDLAVGAVVNVFDTGSVNVQGKQCEEVKSVLGLSSAKVKPESISEGLPRNVFVVYGHDGQAKTSLEAMLRRWQMEPIILSQLPSEGNTIIEKLESYVRDQQVVYGIVLATPDDEGYAEGHPDEKRFRARQNVVLEMGMLLAHLGRSRVAVIIKNPENMERPSDIQGIIYLSYKDDLDKEVGTTLAKEMSAKGIHIDIKKL